MQFIPNYGDPNSETSAVVFQNAGHGIIIPDGQGNQGVYNSQSIALGPASGINAVQFELISSNLALSVGGGSFVFQQSGTAQKAGGGPWSAISDARIKTVEGAYMSGLAAVLALRPVEYRYKNDPAKLHIGLVAQEVEEVMPEMVTKGDGEIDGEKVTDLRTLDTTALVFALVNAVQ